jgi:alpha-amylase
LADEQGRIVIEGSCVGDHASARGTAAETGKHKIFVAGRQLPENGSSFEIEITYTAPKTL